MEQRASGYTATRLALKTAIEVMKNTPMPEGQTPIRAIILMTDGEFNNYGDPFGRGIGYNSAQRDSDYKYYKDNTWNWDANINHHTWFTGLGGDLKGASGANVGTNQNMTVYALNNQPLRIYTISFRMPLHRDQLRGIRWIIWRITPGEHIIMRPQLPS